MPKVSGLINEQELAVCARLRELRKRMGVSQKDLAAAIGITREQLVTVEYGRTPLRYWLADRLCEKFNVSQQWLAIGEYPIIGYVGLPLEIGLEIAPRDLFTSVFDRHVGHIVKRQIQDVDALKQSMAAEIDGTKKVIDERLSDLAECWFRRIPPHLYQEYFGALMAVSSAFFQRNRHRFSATAWPPPILAAVAPIQGLAEIEKRLLTDIPKERNVSSMTEMQDMIARLRKATLRRGKRAELAKHLGVAKARISEWLRKGKTIVPSGQTTLRLLHWVEQQERQLNTLPDAVNTGKSKVTQRKVTYEKKPSSSSHRKD